MTAREFLYQNLKEESQKYFGFKNEKWLSGVSNAWMDDENNSRLRYELMVAVVGEELLKKSRILDMSSGCGTFVFFGLLNHYNVYGVEPEGWKHEFNRFKANEKQYPQNYINKFCYGVGERLPFKDQSFDVISTYQTLEHVQSHTKCFAEFKRVLKKGGYLFIQCPDYCSLFEGHYHMPMLPLMNKDLFKKYLQFFKKPTKGIDGINYITRKTIVDYLGEDFDIRDVAALRVNLAVKKRFGLSSLLLSKIYLGLSSMTNMFWRENNLSYVAVKK